MWIKTHAALAIFLSIAILAGCQEKAELKMTRNSGMISSIDAGIAELSVLDWKVGPGISKVKISKGFRFQLDLPRLKAEDAMTVFSELGVDGWLLRVVRFRKSGAYEVLGHVYAPLVRKSLRMDAIKPATLASVYFNIVYAAVAPSKRFESFVCPAFGHNKLITDARIQKGEISTRSLYITPSGNLRTEAEKVSLEPAQFSGGTELTGEYGVVFALYQSKDRAIMSQFVEVGDRVVIEGEESEYIRGCIDFKPPPREPPTERRFKFGN